jgi:hypothetical protein
MSHTGLANDRQNHRQGEEGDLIDSEGGGPKDHPLGLLSF